MMKQMYKIKTVNHPDKLISYWRSEWLLCIFITVFGLVCNFALLVNPYFEGVLIDDLQNGEPLSKILSSLGIYLLLILIGQAFRVGKRYTVRRFAYDTILSMRLNLYNNLLQENDKELEKTSVGTLLSRCLSDCWQTVEGMRKLTTEIFDTLVVFVYYFAFLMFFNAEMTLYAMIPVTVAVLFAFLMRKRLFQVATENRKVNSRMSGETYDLFDHAMLYRIYGRDEDNLSRYDETLKAYEKSNIHHGVLRDTIIPFVNLIALAGIIPIVLLGAPHVIHQDPLSVVIPNVMKEYWTIGQFSTYVTTFVLLASKASHTARLFSSIERGLSGWKRIQPYIRPYEGFEPTKTLEDTDIIEFHDFSLPIQDRYLIRNLNLKVQKGQIIGITGPVASGKSALGKVFLKELPYEGSVTLFGKEVSDCTREEIKGNITYMGHQSELFTDTIRDNIALGDQKEVMPYLQDVDFLPDMENMTDKEDTLIGNEGLKLSGGQQERLALARTLYHKKGLLILDDPFASVDVRTEKKILDALKMSFQDSVVLLISHRLSCFPETDQVLVLHHDETYSVGSHQELKEKDPIYQNLVYLQEEEAKHE